MRLGLLQWVVSKPRASGDDPFPARLVEGQDGD